MKKTPALIAAFLVTSIIGVAMTGVALSPLLDRSTAGATPAAQVVPAAGITSPSYTEVQQLQARISEYQAREQQYRSLLEDANQQVQALSNEMQQEQQLISGLQQMGILQVDQNGQVTVNAPVNTGYTERYEND